MAVSIPKNQDLHRKALICFKSGHYKEVVGRWTGDSVWMHFEKPNGNTVHINKSEVEYVEVSYPTGPSIGD